ncbi:chaperonin 10-like protein [Fennellomyces sp. T-0311]|nr:chaperonin 10-like protein [Fennellomyces sp. T-0311]
MSMPDIPNKMHVLQAVKSGSAEESLKYIEVDTPKVTRDDELLIQIKAIGVNPVEAKIRSGNASPVPIPFPRVLGGDYAGVVVDKGSKVTDFEIGDEVFGALSIPIGPKGTYAEYVLVKLGSGAIAKKPSNISFEEGAGVGVAFGTAYQAILVLGNLPKEGVRKILVLGGSGGVGTYAVQLAKAIQNTEVVGICSGKNAEFVKSLGADRIVDYTVEGAIGALVKEEAETFDLIVDCVGGEEYYNQLVGLLKKKGTFATAVGPVMHVGADKVSLFSGAKMILTVLGRKLFGCRSYQVVLHIPWDKFASEWTPYFSDGRVKTVLRDDQIFDLKDGVLAHKKIESHRTVGKIILRP